MGATELHPEDGEVGLFHADSFIELEAPTFRACLPAMPARRQCTVESKRAGFYCSADGDLLGRFGQVTSALCDGGNSLV